MGSPGRPARVASGLQGGPERNGQDAEPRVGGAELFLSKEALQGADRIRMERGMRATFDQLDTLVTSLRG